MPRPVTIKNGDVFLNYQNCEMLVIKYTDAFNVLIEFQDKHKHKMIVESSNLRKGRVKNPFYPSVYGIGYFGVGEFVSSLNGKPLIEYKVWSAMLQRCYDKKTQEKRPTYKDCIVCDEWHNFQNFAEWYTSQEDYGKGYHLDKDLLVDKNKVYSPNTCVLTPIEINSLLTDREILRGSFPIGVSFHKRIKKFSASVRTNGNATHLGYFETMEDAATAYQAAKKTNIKRMALEWQNRIDEKLFNALMQRAA